MSVNKKHIIPLLKPGNQIEIKIDTDPYHSPPNLNEIMSDAFL